MYTHQNIELNYYLYGPFNYGMEKPELMVHEFLGAGHPLVSTVASKQ